MLDETRLTGTRWIGRDELEAKLMERISEQQYGVRRKEKRERERERERRKGCRFQL